MKECFRVLRPGGRLLAGMDNGINYLVDDTERHIIHSLPFNPLRDPALLEELQKSDSGIQFSHTLEEQLRGQLQAGSGFGSVRGHQRRRLSARQADPHLLGVPGTKAAPIKTRKNAFPPEGVLFFPAMGFSRFGRTMPEPGVPDV